MWRLSWRLKTSDQMSHEEDLNKLKSILRLFVLIKTSTSDVAEVTHSQLRFTHL